MDAVLEIRGMSKAFGGLQAVRNFDLQVRAKDLIGIIGPNGAGKTTVFNMMTGFIRPDSGEVWFKGENITRLKPFQIVNRGLCRTFQLVDLFKEMTALENVMIPCFSHRASQQRSKEEKPWKAAMKFLEEVGLANRFNEKREKPGFWGIAPAGHCPGHGHPARIFSFWMSPFPGLDVEDAAVLSSAIKQMHQKGQTMIIIEHRLRDLLKLVERVVAIVFGEKIAEGTPQEIMSNPKVVNAYLGERRD